MSIYLGKDKIGSSFYENNARLRKMVEGSLQEIMTKDFTNVNKISDYKFAYSNSLEKVVFNDEVYEIGISAFDSCDNLKDVLSFNGSKIGESAFYYCSKLNNIQLNNRNVEIGRYAFRGCSLRNEIVEDIINNKVSKIGSNCFMECKNLTKLNLTFENFPNDINENILVGNASYFISGTEMPSSLFASCTNLEEVYIGSKIVSIRDYVFSNCPKLRKLTIMSEIPPKIENSGFLENAYNHSLEVIYIPFGSLEKYKSANYWNNFSDIFVEIG